MINWIKKHWEVLSYLVFGVLCTRPSGEVDASSASGRRGFDEL